MYEEMWVVGMYEEIIAEWEMLAQRRVAHSGDARCGGMCGMEIIAQWRYQLQKHKNFIALK